MRGFFARVYSLKLKIISILLARYNSLNLYFYIYFYMIKNDYF